jgi:hypothetical protein
MINRLFSGLGKKAQATNKAIIVVSGLPRSGTSMMMKLLAEAGVPVVSDELRAADMDNPNGYFELEAVKQLPAGNVAWLAEAGGSAVKIISSLLEYLPAEYHYKIIFMEREIQEILASQRKMLVRRQEASTVDDARIAEQFRKHLSQVRPWLARQPNMEVLYISYNSLVLSPEPDCRKVIDYIAWEPAHLQRMLSVPNGALYRNRVAGS